MITETELQNFILKDCKYYLDKIQQCTVGNILLRGSFQKIDTYKKFTHNTSFRKPLHTPKNVHDLVNNFFENKFGWKIRNGAFCYGFNLTSNEIPEELGYGPFFIFFPIGEFKIAYSPKIFDMYGEISTSSIPIEKMILQMDYTANTLCSAIESGDRVHHNVSNEISVYCDSYYLVNYSYSDFISKLIWK